MEITEVRIKLMEKSEDRLRGFCSITFDNCFVVRDLKIIEGNNGPFVAMPSRKLSANCHKCRTKNHLRARYCNHCGARQHHDSIDHDADGRARLYADIAHPVNASCREMIQNRVIEEFHAELDLSSQPGYVSRYDDEYDADERPNLKPKQHETGDQPRKAPAQSNDNLSSSAIDGNQRIDQPESGPAGGHSASEQSFPERASTPQDSGRLEPPSSFGKGILD